MRNNDWQKKQVVGECHVLQDLIPLSLILSLKHAPDIGKKQSKNVNASEHNTTSKSQMISRAPKTHEFFMCMCTAARSFHASPFYIKHEEKKNPRDRCEKSFVYATMK